MPDGPRKRAFNEVLRAIAANPGGDMEVIVQQLRDTRCSDCSGGDHYHCAFNRPHRSVCCCPYRLDLMTDLDAVTPVLGNTLDSESTI